LNAKDPPKTKQSQLSDFHAKNRDSIIVKAQNPNEAIFNRDLINSKRLRKMTKEKRPETREKRVVAGPPQKKQTKPILTGA
jgi:hypothetical protein